MALFGWGKPKKQRDEAVQTPGLQPYKLIVGGYPTENPTMQQIADHIHALDHGTDSFVILERLGGVGDTAYLQVALPAAGFDDGRGYAVEGGVKSGESIVLREYRTHSTAQVVEIFRGYFEAQRAPEHSQWETLL